MFIIVFFHLFILFSIYVPYSIVPWFCNGGGGDGGGGGGSQ